MAEAKAPQGSKGDQRCGERGPVDPALHWDVSEAFGWPHSARIKVTPVQWWAKGKQPHWLTLIISRSSQKLHFLNMCFFLLVGLIPGIHHCWKYVFPVALTKWKKIMAPV